MSSKVIKSIILGEYYLIWDVPVSKIDFIPTHVSSIDELLRGGFKFGDVYFIYGEEKTGKTSLTLTACASAIREDMRPFFIDCSGRIHPERVLQILQSWLVDPSRLSIKIIQSFREQEELILNLYNSKKIFDLIVLDDFTYQHRIELSRNLRLDLPTYKKLALQVAMLYELARREKISVIIVGQVHDMPEQQGEKPVAYRILSHWARWVVMIRKPAQHYREMIIEKPKKKGPAYFTISNQGISQFTELR